MTKALRTSTMESTPHQAFLLLTNKSSTSVILLFQQLQLAVKEMGDLYLLHHSNTTEIQPIAGLNNYYSFTDSILTACGYTPLSGSLLPGSTHFALLHFFANNPSYDYYWFIEDDVRYNGDWSFFFKIIMISSDAHSSPPVLSTFYCH